MIDPASPGSWRSKCAAGVGTVREKYVYWAISIESLLSTLRDHTIQQTRSCSDS